MDTPQRLAEPRDRSAGLSRPGMTPDSPAEGGQSYAEWQFSRHFLMHCGVFAILFLLYVAIALCEPGGNPLAVDAYGGMLGTSAAVFCRWLAKRATNQSYPQKLSVLLFSLVMVGRMGSTLYSTAQIDESLSLDEALTKYFVSFIRVVTCATLLLPSFAFPVYIMLPLNVALALCNWDCAAQLVA
eukprot:1350783-Pleurochrysis_carterae.AAC.1